MITKISKDVSLLKKIIDVFYAIEICLLIFILPVLTIKFGIELPFASRLGIKDIHLKLEIFRGIVAAVSAHIIFVIYEVIKALCNLINKCGISNKIIKIEDNMICVNAFSKVIEMEVCNPFLYSSRTEGLLE